MAAHTCLNDNFTHVYDDVRYTTGDGPNDKLWIIHFTFSLIYNVMKIDIDNLERRNNVTLH